MSSVYTFFFLFFAGCLRDVRGSMWIEKFVNPFKKFLWNFFYSNQGMDKSETVSRKETKIRKRETISWFVSSFVCLRKKFWKLTKNGKNSLKRNGVWNNFVATVIILKTGTVKYFQSDEQYEKVESFRL